ncbi:hypothetical protein LAZ67_19000038 [Cordylochernes scorpioides]|uniref:ATP-dependent DNA helicase n=1 Tax=Cordylochernes scorpioides TaxID=51811 RepID=A0ABY6LLJ1_9ARAC|nr:hypothetical protein LAZ67_19000038 [Cordylochernes scorpioides]
MNFYSYRLMSRANRDNHILKCRTLFQQYIVDMYVKIETKRLLFIRLNQTKLRSENYIHLRDAIATDENPNDLGKMIILPATFAGSPWHMHEYAQDAMTYVRVYDRPDLFITFTCNPRWEEIRELLLPGQSPSNRPDIIARVFNQKLRALMHFIAKYRVFGASQCWMYSIEWQKRGLPHAHILIWLIDKITPDQIDQVISAEIPDIAIDPDLFEVVAKNMIHGPCGAINNNSPCMKDGKCTKRYPRDLHAETITGVDGYPQYRRRSTQDGGKCITIKVHNIAIEVDNRWIVPYSPLLSRTFKVHINVEYCNSVKSIKYICKYVNKGSDMAVFGVKNASAPIDEVQRYQLGHYICSNEAVWRILSFSIHERYPTVVHLAVHLENGQRVYFTAENVRERAASPPQTTLTAFFSLCRGDLFAKTLRYSDVPKYCTWNASEKKFQRRKQGKPVEGHPNIYSSDALSRLYTVHPSNQECFYLRLLLVNVCGPESFQELRTVNGKVCSTYREACQELYLLENDAHWDTTLADASSTAQPHQIRMLFAILLTTCFPSKPMDLWEKYKDSMSEDILHHLRAANLDLQFTPEIYNRALVLIEDICLAIANKRLGQMGLCAPNRSANDSYDRDLQRETHFDVDDLSVFVERNLSKLVPEQRIAYDTLMQAISDQRGGLYFLDAPEGTGKTFLINLILATIRSRNEIAVAIDSSGIAATLLDGGRTAHSALKLPLNLHTIETPTCNISKNSGMGKVLQTCKLIIWDECTMAHKKGLEALDRTLKDLRANGNSFGGALILLSGDFRQTLPVIPRSTPADELNACLKSSVLWPQVKKLMLKTNMRVHLQNDASAERFAKQLLNIGNGKMTIDPTSQCITLPTSFCTLTSSKEELIQKVFPNIAQNYRNLQWLSERAILAAKNIDVNDINFCVQNWVPGEERTYTSIDTVLNEDEAVNYPTEFLNCLDLPGFPLHVLQLKTGVPIILLRNINPPKLCNGTRLSVKTMMNNIIEATILNGKFKGQDVLLPRIPLFPPDLPFEFKRLQFPVRTAFSMTINKAQGQSLKVPTPATVPMVYSGTYTCNSSNGLFRYLHLQQFQWFIQVPTPATVPMVYSGTYTCNSSNGLFRYLHLQQFQWFIQVPTPATVPMVYSGTYTCNSSNGLCRYLHLQQFQWFIQVPTPATVPMVYSGTYTCNSSNGLFRYLHLQQFQWFIQVPTPATVPMVYSGTYTCNSSNGLFRCLHLQQFQWFIQVPTPATVPMVYSGTYTCNTSNSLFRYLHLQQFQWFIQVPTPATVPMVYSGTYTCNSSNGLFRYLHLQQFQWFIQVPTPATVPMVYSGTCTCNSSNGLFRYLHLQQFQWFIQVPTPATVPMVYSGTYTCNSSNGLFRYLHLQQFQWFIQVPTPATVPMVYSGAYTCNSSNGLFRCLHLQQFQWFIQVPTPATLPIVYSGTYTCNSSNGLFRYLHLQQFQWFIQVPTPATVPMVYSGAYTCNSSNGLFRYLHLQQFQWFIQVPTPATVPMVYSGTYTCNSSNSLFRYLHLQQFQWFIQVPTPATVPMVYSGTYTCNSSNGLFRCLHLQQFQWFIQVPTPATVPMVYSGAYTCNSSNGLFRCLHLQQFQWFIQVPTPATVPMVYSGAYTCNSSNGLFRYLHLQQFQWFIQVPTPATVPMAYSGTYTCNSYNGLFRYLHLQQFQWFIQVPTPATVPMVYSGTYNCNSSNGLFRYLHLQQFQWFIQVPTPATVPMVYSGTYTCNSSNGLFRYLHLQQFQWFIQVPTPATVPMVYSGAYTCNSYNGLFRYLHLQQLQWFIQVPTPATVTMVYSGAYTCNSSNALFRYLHLQQFQWFIQVPTPATVPMVYSGTYTCNSSNGLFRRLHLQQFQWFIQAPTPATVPMVYSGAYTCNSSNGLFRRLHLQQFQWFIQAPTPATVPMVYSGTYTCNSSNGLFRCLHLQQFNGLFRYLHLQQFQWFIQVPTPATVPMVYSGAYTCNSSNGLFRYLHLQQFQWFIQVPTPATVPMVYSGAYTCNSSNGLFRRLHLQQFQWFIQVPTPATVPMVYSGTYTCNSSNGLFRYLHLQQFQWFIQVPTPATVPMVYSGAYTCNSSNGLFRRLHLQQFQWFIQVPTPATVPMVYSGTYTCNSSNGLFRYLHLQQFQWFIQVPTPATVPMVYSGTYTCNSSNGFFRCLHLQQFQWFLQVPTPATVPMVYSGAYTCNSSNGLFRYLHLQQFQWFIQVPTPATVPMVYAGTYTCNSSNGLFRYLHLQQFQWFIQVPTPATVPMVYAGTYTCNSSNGLCRYLHLQQFQWFMQVPTPATVPMVYAGTYTCNSSNGLCRYLHLQQFQWFIQVPTPATVPMVYSGTYTCNSSNGLFRYLHLQQFQWFIQVPTPATVPMVYSGTYTCHSSNGLVRYLHLQQFQWFIQVPTPATVPMVYSGAYTCNSSNGLFRYLHLPQFQWFSQVPTPATVPMVYSGTYTCNSSNGLVRYLHLQQFQWFIQVPTPATVPMVYSGTYTCHSSNGLVRYLHLQQFQWFIQLKGANMSALRTYKTLTLAEKIAAIKEVEMGMKKKSDIAKDFGIPRNTLSTYLKNKEKNLRSESECDKGRKRLREPGNPDLDKCVLKWFIQARDKKIPVSGHLIRSKAEQFATEMRKTEFKASSGWLDGFKERNKISFKTICGESGAVNLQVAEQWKNNLRELIQDKDARDVFNVDETGLFFKCTPDKTLAFKHEKCHGGKLSKERVTLLVGANMDGSEKLPLLMIGKAANPRCFKNVKTKPVDYANSARAWMTSYLFEKWLLNLDKRFTKEKRKPMDKGVIKNLKHFYRRFLVENILTGDSEALKIKLDVLQASRLCKKAWDQVTSETIKHCFKKAGFVKKEEDEENADDIIAETMPSVDGWEDVISNPTISYDDFLNVDDDVAVCGEITDADIIAEVLNHNIEKQDGDEASGDEDESSVAGEMNVPSAAEATNYIMQLRRFFETSLRGSLNAYSWLTYSGAWLTPLPSGTWLPPRRRRLMKIWEAVSEFLALDHRIVPTQQLRDLAIIGGCRFLRPPDLLAAARWIGARIGDFDGPVSQLTRLTRCALADATALANFCNRLIEENLLGSHRADNLGEAVVLRGTVTPLMSVTTRTIRRTLERPRLATQPIAQLLYRWQDFIPLTVGWLSLRRCAFSGHNADIAVQLALHALPHPAHPASARETCIACGSRDLTLAHRYWSCSSIRPLIREAFNIIQQPPDLQGWLFGQGLDDDALAIVASAKSSIHRFFLSLEMRGERENPLLQDGEFSSTSLHFGRPLTVPTEYRQSWSRQSGKLGNVHTQKKTKKNEETVVVGKFREQIGVELRARWR